ncbi:hypothetical protein P3L10_000869 [Capsicum annuum]
MDLQFCRSNSYLPSKSAKKIAVDGRDYVDFSYPPPPVGIDATPRKVDDEFELRKSTEEEETVHRWKKITREELGEEMTNEFFSRLAAV